MRVVKNPVRDRGSVGQRGGHLRSVRSNGSFIQLLTTKAAYLGEELRSGLVSGVTDTV